MKKYLLITCLAALISAFATAQQKRVPTPQHLAGNNTFGQDVMIQDTTGLDQTMVKLSTAFNGWQYAAFNTVDLIDNTGGITIRVTRDNGSTWQTIDSYTVSTTRYPAFDIVVAGTDTNNLSLFVAGINNDLSENTYTLYVDQYNATTGQFVTENYSNVNTAGSIWDVAIASDYAIPTLGASPYSVGILYSTDSPTADSIIYIGSLDGGVTWGVDQTVMVTANYFRKVAISYGHSATASNGQYFGAWEMISNLGNRTGNIYASHSTSKVDSVWNNPVDLDSLSANTIGLCRNPSIATMISNADNDSASITEVVLVDRDSLGDGSIYNVLGFYNKVAHATNFWNTLNVANTSENDMQPDIAYCSGASLFFCTYFDSTNQQLAFAQNLQDLATPSTWNFITSQYNDVAANLIAPYPQVAANEVVSQAAFAWIQSNGTNELAMYDSENSSVGIPGVQKTTAGLVLYPNPAIHDINVSVSLKSSSHILVQIYNSLGQLMTSEDLGALEAGQSIHAINIDPLAGGNYFVKVTGDRFVQTEKLVVVK